MKLERIETTDYTLWVSNDEIKEGDYHVAIQIVERVGSKAIAYTDKEQLKAISEIGGANKIIAYQPKGDAPELDLPLLPEIVVEDDVEKIFKEQVSRRDDDGYPVFGQEDFQILKYCIKEIITSSATKVYDEEDLRKAIELSRIKDWQKDSNGNNFWEYSKDEIIKSLKQPKTPKTPKWFVAETEDIFHSPSPIGMSVDTILKTTTINGKTYLIGKFTNE